MCWASYYINGCLCECCERSDRKKLDSEVKKKKVKIKNDVEKKCVIFFLSFVLLFFLCVSSQYQIWYVACEIAHKVQ